MAPARSRLLSRRSGRPWNFWNADISRSREKGIPMKDRFRSTGVGSAILALGIVLLVLLLAGSVPIPEDDFLFKINKGIDLFGRVYKEVTAAYVDVVDPEKFMQAGIDGMLGTLDPYTVYIGKEEGDEVDLMTTGKYGGIGVTIGLRDGAVRVITVMDGYSAQRAGILPGDKLVRIDSLEVGNRKPEEVRNLTRGEPGSEIHLVIEREGEKKLLDFVLIRQEIQIQNVTYTGFVGEGIGYVRLERFSRNAGEEVRQAILELKRQGDLKGLVLDLRGNPGGLLDAAVEVASKFLPRGSLIVSTRGRSADAAKQYVSLEEPVLPTVPLAVLTDRATASASEIVSGSLQDLDRGVIVGTRTFGKGLVQTIIPLNYGAQLKITTARYYTPSGRSIQEIDYMHKDKSGVFAVVPDSLRQPYKTADGRTVYAAGGITPDSVVLDPDIGPMVRELLRKSLFFKFANEYVAAHPDLKITEANDEILQAFREFLVKENFDYQEETEEKVQEIRKQAAQLHYAKELLGDLDLLGAALQKEKQRGFERFRHQIAVELSIELMARLKGDRGRIEESLKDDAQLKAACGILENPKLYAMKLGR
jgi:carboxyl-terminal processing protease